MVAGGGASVIYADTIVDLGGVQELANYGKFRRFHISQLISRQPCIILEFIHNSSLRRF